MCQNPWRFAAALTVMEREASRRSIDLYRDPRESRPSDSIKYSPAVAGQFGSMIARHMALKQKYPDRKLPHAVPYEGIENLRPETKELV